MKCLLFMVIILVVLQSSVLAQIRAVSRDGICTKKEDIICSKRSATYCRYKSFKYQCPRLCKLCVDKPAVSEHKVTVAKARSAMTEVVQDIISSSLLIPNTTRKSTNINRVNEVMYQIERSMGQADLSRKKYKVPELKTDIKEAVKLGNMKFARRTLAIALNTVGKGSSGAAGRRKRSTKLDAKKFLEDLRKDLGDEKFSKLLALEGGKTLMFAIDITGSMHDEIDAAKAITIEISTFKRRAPPSNYILSSFSDPVDVGETAFYDGDQVAEFINHIGNLKATGGADCKEYALNGMLSATEDGPEDGSPLFVFTDAPPKDDTEENMIALLALAELSGITINFFIEEACRVGDSGFDIYKELASETGGNHLRIKENELKRMANFTDTKLGSLATVKSGGTVSKKRKRRSTMDEILIPLDNTVAQAVISVTTENSANGINLYAPSGLTWTEGMNRLSNVIIYILDVPADGNWKLRVPATAGEYQYSVEVSSDENINFHHYYTKKFNKKILEFKHPIAGEPAEVDLQMSGAKHIKKNSVRVDIIDIHGKVLIPNIKPTSNDESGLRYSLTFNPPSEQFKMMVKGRTTKNEIFQRVSQHTKKMKQLVLKEIYNSGRYTIKRGGSMFIMLYLFNGMDTTQAFRISFMDTLGYKVTLLGRKRTTVRAKSRMFLRVSVRYGGGKLGRVGQNENVIVMVKSNHGITTEVIPLMVKK